MNAIKPTPSLRSKIVTASSWVLGGHVVSQVLRLGGNLIMTRLLVPEMFGVMALASVLIVGLALFSDIGLRQNIIQSQRGNDPVFLNTAWTIQVLRGVLICLLAIVLAIVLYFMNISGWLPDDSVYAEPVFPYIIAVLSLTALISGFNSTKLATANRILSMGWVTRIELLSQVTAMLLMITWALFDRSIWALVIGALGGAIAKMILSHKLLPGDRNRFHWDSEVFKEIYHFGKWIFLTSILGFLGANGDRLILGGLVDSITLGIYSIAFFIVNSIHLIFAKIIGSVAFPAFCEAVREQPNALKQVYYKFRLPVDVSVLLVTGLLFSAGHVLIQILYDDRYMSAGHMIEILCIGLFMVRFSLAGQCYMALGKPKLLVPFLLIRVIVLFGFLPIVFNWWGFIGALWLIGGSGLLTLPLTFYFKVKHGLFDFKNELIVLPVLLIGYGTGLVAVQIVRNLEWGV